MYVCIYVFGLGGQINCNMYLVISFYLPYVNLLHYMYTYNNQTPKKSTQLINRIRNNQYYVTMLYSFEKIN